MKQSEDTCNIQPRKSLMSEELKSVVDIELYIKGPVERASTFVTTNECVLRRGLNSTEDIAITKKVSRRARVIGPCYKLSLPPSVTLSICAIEAFTQSNWNKNVYILPVFYFQLNISAAIYIVEWHGIYTLQFDVISL